MNGWFVEGLRASPEFIEGANGGAVNDGFFWCCGCLTNSFGRNDEK
jgi:hypothetical protein